MTSAELTPDVIAPELISELGEAIALHLADQPGPVAESATVQRRLELIENADRRLEAQGLIRNIDAALADDARWDFAVSVHPVQVQSKLWLIDELAKWCNLSSSSFLVLGGWYGILSLLVNWRLAVRPSQMVSLDIDAAACDAGERIVGSLFSNIEYRCGDAMDVNYASLDTDGPVVVVNTVCEHLEDVPGWWDRIPIGQLVALQSNNWRVCPDHVSAVDSIDEFKRQLPLSETYFEGALNFPTWFDRFMLIGRR
jgi:hypothetical protein